MPDVGIDPSERSRAARGTISSLFTPKTFSYTLKTDNRVPHGLTGVRSAAAARQHGYVQPIRDFDTACTSPLARHNT
jgi:hypothetical protein